MDWYNDNALYKGAVAAAAAAATSGATQDPAILQQHVESRFNAAVNKARAVFGPYFNVSEAYVATKLLALLFPFIPQIAGARRSLSYPDLARAYNSGRSQPRREDSDPEDPRELGDADLYIPTISFVTYVLLHGAAKGLIGEFTPAVLSERVSLAVGLVSVEAFLLYGVSFLIGDADNSVIHCIALVCYKFVHLSLVAAVALGGRAQWLRVVQLYGVLGCGVTAMAVYLKKLGFRRSSSRDSEWGRKTSERHKLYVAVVLGCLEALLVFFLAPPSTA